MFNSGKLNYVLSAQDKTRGAFNSVSRNVNNINNQLVTLRNVFIAAFSVRELTRAADDFTNLNNKLLALTGSTDSAAEGLEHVKRIARESRSDLDAVGDLFGKIAFSTSEMGVSLDEVADATQTVMNTFVMAGASAIEASNASRQLAQGLASGTLRGDELNSVMEQNTILAQLLADGLNVSKGALRDLGAEGLITAEKILPILIKEVDNTTRSIKNMQLTIGQSITLLRNSFTEFIGEGSKVVPLNLKIAQGIKFIADNLTLVLIPAFTLLAVSIIPMVKGALIGLFTIIRTNPLSLLVTSLAAATAAFFSFRDEIKKTFSQVASQELEVLDRQIKSIETSLKLTNSGIINAGRNLLVKLGIGSVKTRKELEKLLQEFKNLRKELSLGLINQDDDDPLGQNAFIEAIKGGMKNYEDSIGDTNSRVQKAFKGTFEGIEKVFENFIKTGKIGIKDFVNVVISEFAKLASAEIVGQLVRLIGSAVSGTGNAQAIPGNARGGVVTANKPTFVGEEGVELFVPNRTGRIIPNHNLGVSEQSQQPLNVNFSISALDVEGIDELLIKKKNLLVSMMSQAMNQKGKIGLI